jgi:hypothetical protein
MKQKSLDDRLDDLLSPAHLRYGLLPSGKGPTIYDFVIVSGYENVSIDEAQKKSKRLETGRKRKKR